MKYYFLHYLYRFSPAYRLWATMRTSLRSLLPQMNSAICIEGFPRSGNTFGVIAFQRAQVEDYKISHHLHAESQIIWALKRDIPTILLLRDPLDAVASLVLREPGYSLSLALDRYVKFHQALLPFKGRVVISHFPDTCKGAAPAIAAINLKFGLNFSLPEFTVQSVESVFSEIDKLNLNNEGGDSNMVARPNSDREDGLENLKRLIRYAPQYERARDLYRSLLEGGEH